MTVAEVFVDSSAWFALQATDDRCHQQARRTLPSLLKKCRRLVTSNLVVGETYTLLRVTAGYGPAREFLEALSASAKLDRALISRATERQAYELLHQFADHSFSYVDATSFVLMRQRRIRHAFTFDAHFATAGFTRIPPPGKPRPCPRSRAVPE